jgi:hypothetical protein
MSERQRRTPKRRKGGQLGNANALRTGAHTRDARMHKAEGRARLASLRLLFREATADLLHHDALLRLGTPNCDSAASLSRTLPSDAGKKRHAE